MVVTLFLWLLHLLYDLLARSYRHRHSHPQPITAYRSKLPKHLAIVLVSDNTVHSNHTKELYLECLFRVVKWCRASGIEQLTAYDAEGVLLTCSDTIQERLAYDELPTDEFETELEYPLTPPLSETSKSRSHTPDLEELHVELNVTTMKSFKKGTLKREVAVHRRAQHKHSPCSPLTLHIISRSASKPAIASAARFLLDEGFRRRQNSHGLANAKTYQIPISELNSILEGGLPSPDCVIVHHVYSQDRQPPLELHGFPPWQITLTEIHRTINCDVVERLEHSTRSLVISEEAFCHALDEYAGAQFRMGR